MIDGVEMLYENIESFSDYTYSYINRDNGEKLVYCPKCGKFEKMDVLMYCIDADIKRNTTSIDYNNCSFEEDMKRFYDESIAFRSRKKVKIYKTYFKFYKHERYLKILKKYYSSMNSSNIPMTTTIKKRNRVYHNKHIHSFVCPECKTQYKKENVLYFSSYQSNFMEKCYGTLVFKEQGKNGTLIKMTQLIIRYGIFNNSVITERIRRKVVLNVDTGMSYKMKTAYIGKKKDKHYKYAGIPIKNISYMDCYDVASFGKEHGSKSDKAFDVLYKAVFEHKQALLNHKPDGYDLDYTKYGLDLSLIVALNRFPNIEYDHLKSIIKNTQEDNYIVKLNTKMYKLKHNVDNWPEELLKIYKLPINKFNKKLIRLGCKPEFIYALNNLINDKNNILKLVNNNKHTMLEVFKSEFFKDYVNTVGETIAINRIISAKGYEVSDSARMYTLIKRAMGDYDINYSIEEIHEKLSNDHRKLQHENLPLEYTQKELSLETEFDDCYLKFAKDTYELIDVGSTMNICVGSYGQRAFSKICNIIILRSKEDNSPLVCIELSGDCKAIEQAKYHRNRSLPKDLFDKVTNWVNSNKLELHTRDLNAPSVVQKPAVEVEAVENIFAI